MICHWFNGEIELDLSCSRECITSEISIKAAVAGNPDDNPPVTNVTAIQTNYATFQISNTKRYVPVVTLSLNNNTKFSEAI